MPSGMGRVRRRLNPKSGAVALGRGETLRLAPPWGGYCPDLAPSTATWQDFEVAQGVVPAPGLLGPPTGWSRLDSDSLPLTASAPVVGLPLVFDVTTAPVTLRRYAVTAHATTGRLFELGANWTEITYGGATAGFTGDTSGAGVAQTLCDFAHYQLADRLVLTNGFDVAYQHQPGAATYTDFSPAVLNPFKARSVASAFERVFFLNTSEAGTAFPNRLRGTTRSATPSLSGTGAVLITFDEANSEGVAVRRLGDYLAVYFRRGVALCRETGNLTIPVEREYISRERGLLSTFGVCELGTGVHFCIMTDGWFLLNDSGQFQEVGLRQEGGASYPKWRTTFYRELNTNRVERVNCAFDRRHRQIWIGWPDASSDHPNRLWVYDLETDSVWPQDEIFTTVPNLFSPGLTVSDSVTYSSITTTYETETRVYADLEQVQGADTLIAGGRTGLVFQQDPRIFTVDGERPTYQLRTHRSVLGAAGTVKCLERLDVAYQQQSDNPAVSVAFHNERASVSATISTIADAPGALATDFVNMKSTGSVQAVELSGSHPFAPSEMSALIRDTGGLVRRV